MGRYMVIVFPKDALALKANRNGESVQDFIHDTYENCEPR